MRQVFLDTETTGLYPDQGHRVIEVAAIETFNRRPTGNHFHQFINPQREIDAAAQAVHGITQEFLQDKPLFEAIAKDFSDFVKDAEVIIHNAPFDVGFLNSEFGRLGLKPMQEICDTITDTLKMAKDARPGQRNNLDALCRFFEIDNSRRTLHGALLDAELLAEVYMALTRGQDSLMIDLEHPGNETSAISTAASRGNLKVLTLNDTELAEHDRYLQGLGDVGVLRW